MLRTTKNAKYVAALSNEELMRFLSDFYKCSIREGTEVSLRAGSNMDICEISVCASGPYYAPINEEQNERIRSSFKDGEMRRLGWDKKFTRK